MQKVFLLFLLVQSTLVAASFRVRAREHFEWHEVKSAGQSASYFGLSNTFNVWWEEPFNYAIGLSAGPLLGSAKNQETAVSPSVGDKIVLYSIGVEFKYFPYSKTPGLFTRFGLGWSHLDTNGTLGNVNGWNFYSGLGWEFKVWKLGIAPEIAVRYSDFANGVEVMSFTPSLGIHFYVM